MPTTKPIITKKGRFADGRSRYCIVWFEEGRRRIKAIPKPEDLLKGLDTLEKLNFMRENEDTFG